MQVNITSLRFTGQSHKTLLCQPLNPSLQLAKHPLRWGDSTGQIRKMPVIKDDSSSVFPPHLQMKLRVLGEQLREGGLEDDDFP